MRRMFATMLVFSQVSNNSELWGKNWQLLCDDILYRQRRLYNRPELNITVEEINDLCLLQIEELLQKMGTTLSNIQGGRTAHSRFHIPIKLIETSTCDIYHGTGVAKLIQHTSLIIWDETPMIHKFCIEALDRSLRDILRDNNPNIPQQPYGGMTVIFGGDFR